MSWLRNITRSGISDDDGYQKRRGILLSNYIALILMAGLTLMFIVRRGYFSNIPGGMSFLSFIFGLIIFLSTILLSRIGLRTAGKLLLCYTPVIYVWYSTISVMYTKSPIEQATYDSARILLLAVSFIPYLILDRKKPLFLIMGILPTLISLVFFNFILSQFGLGVQQQGISGEEAMLIGIRTLVAYGILSISCFIFQSIITYNDDLNKTILTELKEKSEEIKAQNEELVQSQDRLNEINLHLEEMVAEKTANIKQQHEKLLKYAHANAHHVRGPVARLLGLIQLTRIKTDLDYPWFFEKVEHETGQIDEILKGIARELDEITQESSE